MVETLTKLEDFLLGDAGSVPNNWLLPLVIYREVLGSPGSDAACELERTFARHGWPPAWRFGIYDFVHYHSSAHEAVGISSGRALVRFGHTAGVETWLETGDVAVIPAGVGHQALEWTPDFLAVGAYPAGQKADMMRGIAGERPASDQRIDKVPLPASDPVFGKDGPLMALW
jgi:uncharacterized protein YjlB